jgi:outer membrane scaffolding protein for murein synthesis (MipA/OmpV family)
MVGSINAGQNDNRASIGSSWRYLGNFTVEARYNAYLGSANNSPLADRDNVALNFKYRF